MQKFEVSMCTVLKIHLGQKMLKNIPSCWMSYKARLRDWTISADPALGVERLL
jgi:hypothetical protein